MSQQPSSTRFLNGRLVGAVWGTAWPVHWDKADLEGRDHCDERKQCAGDESSSGCSAQPPAAEPGGATHEVGVSFRVVLTCEEPALLGSVLVPHAVRTAYDFKIGVHDAMRTQHEPTLLRFSDSIKGTWPMSPANRARSLRA